MRSDGMLNLYVVLIDHATFSATFSLRLTHSQSWQISVPSPDLGPMAASRQGDFDLH